MRDIKEQVLNLPEKAESDQDRGGPHKALFHDVC
jgi:hypothetical protein